MATSRAIRTLVLFLALLAGSCTSKVELEEYALRDDIKSSNVAVGPELLQVQLVDSMGHKLDLEQFRGKKNVVLVVMRGFSGLVCPYCTAQTSRLITNFEKFQKRDAEVLVVYPGKEKYIDEFVEAARSQASNAKVPFPILLDEDLALVDKLGIRSQLAKPSVYILDKSGNVRFAYVGSNLADRPSLKVLLKQLDMLNET